MTTLHSFPHLARVCSSHLVPTQRKPGDRLLMQKSLDLFVLLHGMLFTNIQLDDFQPTLARFVECLEIKGAAEREWIMMAGDQPVFCA